MDNRKLIIIVGVSVCILGFLFSAKDWSSSSSFMYNIGNAEIVIFEGKEVYGNTIVESHVIDLSGTPRILEEGTDPSKPLGFVRYQGRLVLPLRYVLCFGIVIIAIGIGMLIMQPKRNPNA
jgi:hypothetical protein